VRRLSIDAGLMPFSPLERLKVQDWDHTVAHRAGAFHYGTFVGLAAARKKSSGLDRREGSDVIIGDSVIFPLPGVGSKGDAQPAEGFGYDRRQGQSAIETTAVELIEAPVRLLPVPNKHDIVGPCMGPIE
jgi:hypothetical protein